ncbi:MAG: DUF4435 domain-containing protein, partial [Bacteroidaceae bacterium]|nr:DUF4435 domain-containing protein [Bacteroidaceae bacterium]
MNIRMPDRMNGSASPVLDGVRQITLIGANGSGKTRFAHWLVDKYKDQAFRISALKALFPSTEKNELSGSIDLLYDDAVDTSPFYTKESPTEFQRLIFLLLHDEFLDLLKFKAKLRLGDGENDIPETKFDKVARMWHEVFPNNKVMRDGGRLLFSNDKSEDTFSELKLSDGEKAVLYYIGAVQYAQPNAIIFVDDPEIYIHHSIMKALWNVIEEMRPDCTFVYNTHDIDFVSSRTENVCIWVRNYDLVHNAWDYEIVEAGGTLSEQLYFDLLGSRNPILFVEGDASHSIDSKLYSLIFTEYTVKPLGSCDKVIEATRAFNDLQSFHHLDSHGIVDRDRRSDNEVQYLRDKKILVPNVAEIENILMLEGVVRAVARWCKKNDLQVATKVKAAVMKQFKSDLRKQALEHVRHRMKRMAAVCIDRRFKDIGSLEDHISDLLNELTPRAYYEELCRDFHRYVSSGDYNAVLKVFNEKTMLVNSNVAGLCGLASKDDYIRTVLHILKGESKEANDIREAIKRCFGI